MGHDFYFDAIDQGNRTADNANVEPMIHTCRRYQQHISFPEVSFMFTNSSSAWVKFEIGIYEETSKEIAEYWEGHFKTFRQSLPESKDYALDLNANSTIIKEVNFNLFMAGLSPSSVTIPVTETYAQTARKPVRAPKTIKGYSRDPERPYIIDSGGNIILKGWGIPHTRPAIKWCGDKLLVSNEWTDITKKMGNDPFEGSSSAQHGFTIFDFSAPW
ncbi:hypothetical protein EX30DRAFT_363069 [Ascodesmis nigricans]|uniref:Uncharacterized protein n=1 Tax=Ascodesmis nigricans TaxID=341454 RepID=A0A4S2N0U9_9PEZI|nr:hypothetical protein EX30DRAFT_363069 [Ascodesmis nigricans]